jgi:hypothetical protein
MTLQYIQNEFNQICFTLQSFSNDFKNKKTLDDKFVKEFDDVVTTVEFLRNLLLAESNKEDDEQQLNIEKKLREIEHYLDNPK